MRGARVGGLGQPFASGHAVQSDKRIGKTGLSRGAEIKRQTTESETYSRVFRMFVSRKPEVGGISAVRSKWPHQGAQMSGQRLSSGIDTKTQSRAMLVSRMLLQGVSPNPSCPGSERAWGKRQGWVSWSGWRTPGWEQGMKRQGEAVMPFCFLYDSGFVSNLFLEGSEAAKAEIKILCAKKQMWIT